MTVNQQLTPLDFVYQETGWHVFGQLFQITGDTLTVQLSDAADNAVVADAIQIEFINEFDMLPPLASVSPLGALIYETEVVGRA